MVFVQNLVKLFQKKEPFNSVKADIDKIQKQYADALESIKIYSGRYDKQEIFETYRSKSEELIESVNILNSRDFNVHRSNAYLEKIFDNLNRPNYNKRFGRSIHNLCEAIPESESENWYLSRNGQTYGPYSKEQLINYAAEGRIAFDDLVHREGDEGWQLSGSVHFLFSPDNEF